MIRDGEIDTVIVAFPDHFGQLMGKRITGDYFLQNSRVESCSYLLTTDIEMNPLEGFGLGSWEQGYGDFQIVLDPSSITIPAWLSSTALIIGDLKDQEGNEVEVSPRAILKRQYRRAEQMGVRPMMASELEFYLFSNSYRDVASSGYAAIQPVTAHAIDYQILGSEESESVIREIRNKISASGIPVESSKGETGRGQFEIALEYGDALRMADRHIVYKYGAKAIAAAAQHSITFMAKYSDRDAGSSCHIHCSLADAKTGKNLFWADPRPAGKSEAGRRAGKQTGMGSGPGADGEAGSEKDRKTDPEPGSDLYRYFLGGLHALSAELFLFFAPTVNSYKRFSESSFAPTKVSWDYDNRTAGFRVIGADGSFRIENRMPGADANPYVAYAATLAAGLYGIEHRLEPPANCTGNAYRAGHLQTVPMSLESAAKALDGSKTAREIFGNQVVDHYVRHAMLEAQAYSRVVGEWELKRYFERI